MNADVVLPLLLLVGALVVAVRPSSVAARVRGHRAPPPDEIARVRRRDVVIVLSVALTVAMMALVLLLLGLGESSSA
ncbi:MAG: hypothetical protein AB7I24_11065 [Candidatus Nanopelagicales bacterium]